MADVNLLSYTGNAGLGMGGSSADVLPAKTDLDEVNKAGQNIMLMSAQRNAQMFQQKVKDRDVLLDMLAKGQVQAGDILPEDRKYFDEAEKEAETAFFKIGNLNDTKQIEAYTKANRRLKDVTIHAQARKVQDTFNRKDVNDETNPFVKGKKESEYGVQRKKQFWDPIDPLQAVFQYNSDYNNDLDKNAWNTGTEDHPIDNAIKSTGATTVTGAVGLNKGAAPSTSTSQPMGTRSKLTVKTQDGKTPVVTQAQTTFPEKPVTGVKSVSGTFVKEDGKTYEVSTGKVSFDKILDNANSMVYNPQQEPFWHNREHLALLQDGMPTVQSKPILDTYVKAVERYKKETGDVNNSTLDGLTGVVDLDRGQQVPDGKRPIAVIQNGKLQVAVSSGELAALDKLSKMGSYTSSTKKWREDIDKFDLSVKKEKDANALGWARLAQQRRMNSAKIKALESLNEDPTAYLTEQWKKNATSVEREGHLGSGNVPTSQNMPIEFLKGNKLEVLKPFNAKEIKTNGKVTGYEGGSYKYQYQGNDGKVYSRDQVAQNYIEFKNSLKKATPAQKEAYKNINSVDDYVSELINKGVYNYSVEGANGKITMDQWIQSQKAISNMTQKKGQSSIFNGMEGVIFGPDDSEISVETSSSSSGNPNDQ